MGRNRSQGTNNNRNEQVVVNFPKIKNKGQKCLEEMESLIPMYSVITAIILDTAQTTVQRRKLLMDQMLHNLKYVLSIVGKWYTSKILGYYWILALHIAVPIGRSC